MSADRLSRELRIRTGTRWGLANSPVAVRSSFFLGIDRERKTPTQILLRGASILPVGALGPGASRVCSSFWEEWQEWVSKFMSGDSLRPFYLSIWAR